LATENKDFKVKHGLQVTGGATFGQPISVGTPTASDHAATKAYAENYAEYYGTPTAVVLATTTSINISTGLVVGATIDGVEIQPNTRVLVKDQTDAKQNGIYIAESSSTFRDPAYNTSENMRPGSLVVVLEGLANANTFWYLSSLDFEVGTDPINFDALVAETNLTAGVGIAIENSQISIDLVSGNGIIVLDDTISVDSTKVATLLNSDEIDPLVTKSSLTSVGSLDSLEVLGNVDLRSGVEIDGLANVAGSIDITENLEVGGSSTFVGTANFQGAVTVPAPTLASHAVTKTYVDALVNQESVEVTTIDDLSNYFNGFESRFKPTYQGIPVTLQNPFNLLLTIDGIIQSVGYPDYVWQSVMPRVGFRIDNDGYIAFPEQIPVGSSFDARVLVGSATTQQTKVYPFKAMDIVLGGY
jgi:hypothetical protein